MPKVKTPKKKKSTSKKVAKEEFEKRTLELAGQGLTAEKIGETLRQEGIHSKEHSIKISKILKSHNLYTDPELKNVGAKLERIKKHFEKNKQDKRSVREKERVFSQVRKIKKYLNLQKE